MTQDTDPKAPRPSAKGFARKSLLYPALIVLGILLLWGGGQLIDINIEGLERFFARYERSPLGLPLTILFFTAFSFLAAPQWMLMAGAIGAFGPWLGGFYAWVATLCAASANFWAGRKTARRWLAEHPRPFVQRLVGALQKNGFLVSFGARFVPLGPFIFVNMAAGAAGVPYRAFIAGTALGIIPKIAAIAFLGQGLMAALRGESGALAFGLLGFIIMVILGALLARTKAVKSLLSSVGSAKNTE